MSTTARSGADEGDEAAASATTREGAGSEANTLSDARPAAGGHEAVTVMGDAVDDRELRRRARAWAWYDWGGAAFTAVVTTFVFGRYLSSDLFADPKLAIETALAHNTATLGYVIAAGGLAIALFAPVIGQRSDGAGRRKLWLGVNAGIVALCMAAMFLVQPAHEWFLLGAVLLSVGTVFFEIAGVNYNAMLVQVSTPKTMGKVSGFGWSMGYFGGIVLLVILLVLFLQPFGVEGYHGLLHVPDSTGGSLDVRFAILFAALWFAAFAIPVLVRVPELPASKTPEHGAAFLRGIGASYRTLFRTIGKLGNKNPGVLVFLVASALFRDGLAGVFTFGAIIASVVFGFTASEVMYFGVASNVVAGLATVFAGRADDRFGSKRVMVFSLVALVLAGAAIAMVPAQKPLFWVLGLILCLFVGPIQASSRTFLARITPPGREGEIFGLYATTGRAVSFLAPLLWGLFVSFTGNTRYGVIGIVVVLLAGLAVLVFVTPKQRAID